MKPVNPDQLALHQFVNGNGAAPMDANPMAVALGTSIVRVDRELGEVELHFEPADLFVQGAGVLQGGAVTSMLDFAMGFSVLANLPAGYSCATANLNVAFLRAAPRGGYGAIGQIERRGKRLAFTRASLFPIGAPQQPVATASSTLTIL